MENQLTKSDRIAERIRPEIAGETAIKGGMMAFRNIEQIMEFGKVMSIASVAIPKHLRDNPGACLAVAIQASEWEMSPFSVANKTYVVNDRLAYEAQLINAVILRRAPILGRFAVEYKGEDESRQCTVRAKLKDGDEVEYTSPKISKIPVKNSPLWKGDPDQQLFYYSSRAMCRRHFPDVILGIYAPDEIEELKMAEATEVPAAIKFGEPLLFATDKLATEAPAAEKPKRHRRTKAEIEAEKHAVDFANPPVDPTVDQSDVQSSEEGTGTPEQVAAFQKAAEPPSSPFDPPVVRVQGADVDEAGNVTQIDNSAPVTWLFQLRQKLLATGITEMQLKRYLAINGHIDPADRFEKMTDEKLSDIVNSYDSILDDVKESIK